MERLSIGTAALITPDALVAAAALIERGAAFSLALPLGGEAPVAPHRTRPLRFDSPSGPGFEEDFLALHTHSGTHWDALRHCGGDTSIDRLAASLIGRGVLLDLPRHLGVRRLEPGFAIKPDLLEACAAAESVQIRSGDILLLRTGHLAWFASLDDKRAFDEVGEPGIGHDTVAWLREREIAALAADNTGIEVRPPDLPGEQGFPLHPRLLRDLGLTLGELWYLEELAEACAADGRWEFFLSAAPLAIEGASGSPINPVAIK
jgi:kynurenine formamidase